MNKKKEMKLMQQSPQVAELERILVQNGGVRRKEVVNYGIDLFKQVVNYNTPAILVPSAMMLLSMFFPSVALHVVPFVALSLAVLSTPLFFIGVAGLAATGIRLLFGSSEGRVFVAVSMILNQRLFLAIEGIRIEDYY